MQRTDDGLQVQGATMLRDEILDPIPTTFGRLAALASFRVPGTAEYQHRRLDEVFPASVVTAVLSQAHQRTFADWLSQSLEDQYKQLSEFLENNRPAEKPDFSLEVQRRLIPPAAKTAEETLFLSDLACLCDVMGIEP